MYEPTTLKEWENLVEKQLKTGDIYSILNKENLEDLHVKPYYNTVSQPLLNLPKVEESTLLVADYHENLENEVYAFLLNHNVEGLEDKTLFINNLALAEHLSPEDSDRYFSLIDPFDENARILDDQKARELLAKDFKRSLCVDVALHQNAGASVIQQVALVLSKTKELVEHFGAEILPNITVRIASGSNYFFEIAKIRALKLAFNQLSREYNRSDFPYIFAETTFRNKTISDPENNLIRSTLELAAAMIGGADAVFANDYHFADSTDLSREISFKQQIVLAYESIVNVFEDAGNGSYYIEEITQQIADKAWRYFVQLEEKGGYLAGIQSGEIQQEIYRQAVAEQQWVQEGRIKLIGINMYPKLEPIRNLSELYAADTINAVRWSEMFE